MIEIWKQLRGFPNYYISNYGRVKSLESKTDKKKRILKLYLSKSGYSLVTLYIKGKRYRRKVARLVAINFIPNFYDLPQVNHKNGIKTDDRVVNLEWCTASMNIRHAFDNGLIKSRNKNAPKGENSVHSKLTQKEVNSIRKEYAKESISHEKLGKKYGVTKSNIMAIVNYKTWKET